MLQKEITGDPDELAALAEELLDDSPVVDVTYPSGDRLAAPGTYAAAELDDDGRFDQYSVDITVERREGRWSTDTSDMTTVYTIDVDADDGTYQLEGLLPDHPTTWVKRNGYDCTVKTAAGTEVVGGRRKA